MARDSQPDVVGSLRAIGHHLDVIARADPDVFDIGDVGEVVKALDATVSRVEGLKFDWAACFARRNGPKHAGRNSLAHWFQADLRKSPGQAKREADTARALARDLSRTREALKNGDISAEAASEIAKATKRQEPDEREGAEDALLGTARGADARQVKKHGQRLTAESDRKAAEAKTRRAWDQRHASIRHRNGQTFLDARLPQLGGEKLSTALNALASPNGKEDERTYGQRLADALVELADRSLATDVLPQAGKTRAAVIVNVTVDDLEKRAGLDVGTLDWSGPISAPVLEQLVCEAGLEWLVTNARGTPLNYGQSRPVANRAQRRALGVRDGGCRWPGCRGKAQWAIAHHVTFVGQPGWTTNLDNLVLVCGFHHNMIHQAGWTLTLGDEETDWLVTVTSLDGTKTSTETASRARARHLHGDDPVATDATVADPDDRDEQSEKATPRPAPTPPVAANGPPPSLFASETSAVYDANPNAPPSRGHDRSGSRPRAGPSPPDPETVRRKHAALSAAA